MAQTGAETVSWNLDDLVPPPVQPGVEAVLAAAEQRADAFGARYRGRVAELDGAGLAGLLTEYEQILEAVGRAESFASLWWSARSDEPARGALLQRVSERQSALAQKLVFLDIEWANAPDEHARGLLADPALARWRHWLLTARRYRPHLLSESEEKVLAEKSVTGRQAWTRFFDETMAATRFSWKGEQVPAEVVLRQLYDADRQTRRAAAGAITEGLQGIRRITTYAFNTLLAEKASDDRLRRYPSWISSRNMDNQVADSTVDALVAAVTSRYGIVARYYRLKKRLLGLEELFDYDRYAALAAAARSYSWDDARQIVLGAYRRFHPAMAEIASMFFDKRWLDAAVRPGKRGGAFSASTVPSAHPYILLSFQGTAQDVMTLAHELGHGVHQYLARDKGVLLQNTPLTTAETASLFGETLVFHDLRGREKDASVLLSMLVRQIESSFATVFRQVAMNRFEAAAHTARRERGELTTEDLSGMWTETQRAMFADSVTLTEDYGIWWSYITHFVHVPGYVYAYAFGDLLVRSLYRRFQSAGSDFPSRYLRMLAAGGSDWPEAIVKPLGVDLSDPGFWNQGLDLLEEMVREAESLAGETTAAATSPRDT
ncbi:MAG TPA: M3 family oligoendopeptidase [Spirochaetia bacterium]|nr:M3 family oligoendopeptidase [Spirochaetia bacterium]